MKSNRHLRLTDLTAVNWPDFKGRSGIKLRYGRVPTIRTIISGPAPAPALVLAAMLAALSAPAIADAASLTRSGAWGEYAISTPVSTFVPALPHGDPTPNPLLPFRLLSCHPACFSRPSNWHINPTVSSPEATERPYCVPANGSAALTKSACSLSANLLGASRVSNAMIFSFWDWIIRSSNSNRNIVAAASIITPKNTQAVGQDHKWPSRQASQIIPPPTNAPPVTVIQINTNSVVDGSPLPETKWLRFAKISAPLILVLFGAGYAVIAIIRWLLSLAWRA
jgi:hypothetical protein